jgi:hypothetical protein
MTKSFIQYQKSNITNQYTHFLPDIIRAGSKGIISAGCYTGTPVMLEKHEIKN